MSEPREPTRAVLVLGHPVAGLAPISLLSAGWLVLGLQVIPWFRDRYASVVLGGGHPVLADVWPLPPQVLTLALTAGGLLLVGLALLIVWVESAGGFGPLSDRLLRRGESLAGIVLIAAGVLSAALLARGEPSLGDTKTHLARGWLWFDYMRAGTFPRWTDLWYGGFPVDQRYPPLAHILQALIDFLTFSPHAAAKLLAWFCRISGAVGFALLCARAHRDQRAGLLGGILYALSPAFHAAWIWEGRLPAALLLGILPWAFLAAERVSTGIGGIRAGAGFALAIGALVLAHTAEARLALVLLGAFTLARVIPTAATRGVRAPSVAGILIGWLGGATLAACFLYPIVRESSLVNSVRLSSMTGFVYHFPPLRSILETLRWSPMGRQYLGVSVAILAVGGVVRAVLDRREGGRGIGPIPLAVLVLLPWCLVIPERRGSDLVFVGALLAAAGIVRRSPLPPRARLLRKGLYPVALLLAVVDLAPISLVTTYGVHSEGREQIYANLQGRMVSGRFLEMRGDEEGRPSPGPWSFAAGRPLPSVGGPYLQGAPNAFLHAAAMIDTVAHAMAGGRPLPQDLVRLLAIHDVRYVLVTTRQGSVLTKATATRGFVFDPEIPGMRVEESAPVAVLEPGFPPGPSTPAARFLMSGLPPKVSRDLAREEIAWLRKARPRMVRDARAVVLPNRMEIEVPDLGPVTLRIARNAYPFTEVRVNDRPWPWHPGPLGGILVDLDAGVHKIVVRGIEDTVRRGCRYAQWGLAALLFLLAIGPRRR